MQIRLNGWKKAAKILNGVEDDTTEESNPVQIEKCPWCGHAITPDEYHCDSVAKRMKIKCPNANCGFHSGLPVYLIDEEIYEHSPTFIVSTVDKFAQIALNQDTNALFGISKNNNPP